MSGERPEASSSIHVSDNLKLCVERLHYDAGPVRGSSEVLERDAMDTLAWCACPRHRVLLNGNLTMVLSCID